MRPILAGFGVVIALGGALYAGWVRYRDFLTAGSRPPPSTQKLNEMQDGAVPRFSSKDLAGQEVSLEAFSDRVVIVNFWASWCDPCVAEFPSMIRLVEFFQGRVVLLAISADEEETEIRKFLQAFKGAQNPNIKVIWDRERVIGGQFGTEVLPESYILGKGLKFIKKIAGSEDWFAPGAIQLFQELTTESGPELSPDSSSASSDSSSTTANGSQTSSDVFNADGRSGTDGSNNPDSSAPSAIEPSNE